MYNTRFPGCFFAIAAFGYGLQIFFNESRYKNWFTYLDNRQLENNLEFRIFSGLKPNSSSSLHFRIRDENSWQPVYNTELKC